MHEKQHLHLPADLQAQAADEGSSAQPPACQCLLHTAQLACKVECAARSAVTRAAVVNAEHCVQLIADAQKDATHVNDLALARKTAIERRKEQEEQRLLQAEELEHAKRVQIARQTEAAEEDRRRADRQGL